MKKLSFTKLFFFVVVSLLVTASPLVAAEWGGIDRSFVDNKTWQIYVYPSQAFSGYWVFHADRRVEGINGSGQVQWTGTWRHLGQNRYSYEFDYQGSHNVEYVEFVGQGQSAELRGFGDPSFRNQHRVGRLTAGSPQVTADRGGIDRSFVDNKTWQIYVYPSQAFSGYWVFHADRRVEGINGSGQVQWTGTWRHLGQNRYSYEFDYQGSHNVEYVEFVGQGQSAELRGYGDPSFRNQHRVGRLAAGSPQVTADRGGIDRSFVDNKTWQIYVYLPRLSPVIGSFMPTGESRALTARGVWPGQVSGGISARTDIRTSLTTRAATTSSMSSLSVRDNPPNFAVSAIPRFEINDRSARLQ